MKQRTDRCWVVAALGVSTLVCATAVFVARGRERVDAEPRALSTSLVHSASYTEKHWVQLSAIRAEEHDADARAVVVLKPEFRGVVLDARGRQWNEPWTLALIHPLGHEEHEHFGSGRADFTYPLTPGVWRIRAECAGFASETIRVDTGLELPLTRIVMTLAPTVSVRGSVLQFDGAPLSACSVGIVSENGAWTSDTSTATDGTFEFEGTARGTYSVHVGDRESPLTPSRRFHVTDEDAPPLSLVLPELESVRVRVVDRAGEPVGGALVTATGSRGGSVNASTNNDGWVAADRLPLGTYRVVASRPREGRSEKRFRLDRSEPASEVVMTLTR